MRTHWNRRQSRAAASWTEAWPHFFFYLPCSDKPSSTISQISRRRKRRMHWRKFHLLEQSASGSQRWYGEKWGWTIDHKISFRRWNATMFLCSHKKCAIGEPFLNTYRTSEKWLDARFGNSEDLILNKSPVQDNMMINYDLHQTWYRDVWFENILLVISMFAKFDIGISWYHVTFIWNFACSYDDSWYMMVNNDISAKNNMYKSAIIEKKPLLVKRQYVKP